MEAGLGLELDATQRLGDVALELGLERLDGVDEAGVELESVVDAVVLNVAHDRAEVERGRDEHGIRAEGLVGSGVAPEPDLGRLEGDA